MSDEIDVALDALLAAPIPAMPDDGFSHAVLARISDAERSRAQTRAALLAAACCVLFAGAGGLALSQPVATPTALLPVVLSLALASLILSFSVQQLFRD